MTEMALESATPRASGTTSKTVATKTEPVAPEASKHIHDDYVYSRAPREKLAPVDSGITETVQHQLSPSAGPQKAAPVLHSVPVQSPALASQQCGVEIPAPFISRACGNVIGPEV